MKLLLSKKTKTRMKRACFLLMAIQFFCSSIFPSLGVARISSPSVDDQIHISEGSRVEMESLLATGARSDEATDEEELEYDPQPETIEQVQECIDKYLESDNAPSEKPNWEEEVDEELVPEGWRVEFVEDGDEYFGKDYYTIFLDYDPQPEKIEEVRDWIKIYLGSDNDASERPNWEEEVKESLIPNGWEIAFIEDGDEHFDGDYYTFDLVYDPQPETIEEVRDQVKDYVESDKELSERPNWEEELEGGIIPSGWVVAFVEGGDEHFEADYYTLSVDYDSQPETIEEVREWIKKYLDSDKDLSERPNWEKEVKEDLIPNGWEVEFVESGDQYFEADYYTISLRYDSQPETIEEVREWIKKYLESDRDPSERPNWEKEVDKNIIPNGWEVEFIEGGDENFEADYYTISLNYDPQPETIEDVQEWIDRYEESDNDKSEKPNWEREVDEELMPDGWYNDLVEGGDEHFEADYYTIFQEDEEREEVAEEQEEEADEEETEEEQEEETFEYDPQPKSMADVQVWIDKHEESNYDPSVKPHWEFDVEAEFMPDGWKTDFVKDGDEFFGLDFYTIFPVMMMARDGAGDVRVYISDDFTAEPEENFTYLEEAVDFVNQNSSVEYWIVMGNSENLTSVLTIENTEGVTILSDSSLPSTAVITTSLSSSDNPDNEARHFVVNGSLTLQNIILDGSTDGTMNTASGGGVGVSNGGSFTMNDGAIIRNCLAVLGGAVWLRGDENYDDDAVNVENDNWTSKFTMTGGKISDNMSEGGGGVLIQYNSLFEMKDEGNGPAPEIIGNSTKVNGSQYQYQYAGGVGVEFSTFKMSAGKINDNTAIFAGGGVVLGFGSEFVLEGGEITDNNATRFGGGVVIGDRDLQSTGEKKRSTFEMNGGTIEGNHAGEQGGGVIITSSDFKMSAGEIMGNDTRNAGGGVWVGAYLDDGAPSTFTMSGDSTISNNTTTTGTPERDERVHDYFSVGGGVMVDDGSTFTMMENEEEDAPLITGNSSYHHGGGVHVQAKSTFNLEAGTISNNTSSYAGGGVYVGYQNFVVDGDPAEMDDSEFVMTGGIIEWNKTVYDTKVNRRFLYGGGVHVDKANFEMSGGEISNNIAAHSGGGVSIASGNFDMTDGTISGNKTDSTSIRVGYEAEGREIEEENLYTFGGGVWVGRSYTRTNTDETPISTFTMTGGTIGGDALFDKDAPDNSSSGNYATNSGGGIYISRGTVLNISDNAEITYNFTDRMGGGIYAGTGTSWSAAYGATPDPSIITMSGGLIKGNESVLSGGGIYVTGVQTDEDDPNTIVRSIFNMSGGTIEDNHTKTEIEGAVNSEEWAAGVQIHGLSNGGGAAIILSEFNFSGDAKISGNSASHIGGGVHADNHSIVNMSENAEISNNETQTWDGGILIHWKSEFNMSGGRIVNNTSVFNGGGVGIISSEFEMSGGLIAGNKTTSDEDSTGGGVMIGGSDIVEGGLEHPSYFKMTGGIITGNMAMNSGGGVSIEDGSTFEMVDEGPGGAPVIGGEVPGGVEKITYSYEYTDENNVIQTKTITIDYGNHTLAAGGGVNIQGGSTFNMSAGEIIDNDSNLTGGGVYVVDTRHNGENEEAEFGRSTFNMSGGLIQNNSASYGISLDEDEAAAVGVEDLANGGGVAIVRSDFNMNGNKNGIFTDKNGPFPGGAGTPVINDNHAVHIGGGVFADDGSIVYMYGDAVISENDTETWDGGILIHWNSKFYMHGGYVINNESVYNGGGVGIISGDFVMTDGLIAGNRTTSDEDSTGGGVMIGRSDIRGDFDVKSTFEMSGGQITENMAMNSGGGVSIEDDSVFTMMDGKIGGSIDEDFQIPDSYFQISYKYTYDLKNSEGVVTSTVVREDTVQNGNLTAAAGGGVNIQGGSTLNMSGGKILENKSEFTGGGVFVIDTKYGVDASNDPKEYFGHGSEFNMTGGTIANNETLSNVPLDESAAATTGVANLANGGGAAIIRSNFNMSGEAEIDNNHAQHIGGGVFADDNSTVIMDGNAVISNNTTNTWDGGILIHWESTFEMHGGSIINNTSVYNGGGVGIISSDFEMTDGLIAGNQTTSNIDATGGGVMVGRSDIRGDYDIPGTFKMTGGTITGNKAVHSGGGVSIEDGSTFDMSGTATIGGPVPDGVNPITSLTEGNRSDDRGGGVFLQAGSTFNMDGGTVSKNSADRMGGGVYITSMNSAMDQYYGVGTFNLKGGSITENTTNSSSGGVAVNQSYFYMSGGDITNNTSLSKGGGVGITSSSFEMRGGTISGNKTTQAGSTAGGVWVTKAVAGAEVSYPYDPNSLVPAPENVKAKYGISFFTMYDGSTIKKNTAVASGGGVSVEERSMFEMKGGTIGASKGDIPDKWDATDKDGYVSFAYGNSTEKYGGGVNVQQGSTFIMKDGSIRGNYSGSTDARTGGGGVFVGTPDPDNPFNTDPDFSGTTGTFEMLGGEISHNSTNRAGAGVYIHINGVFLLDGGKIVDNRADSNLGTSTFTDMADGGGGVYVYTGKITMNDGEVSRNGTWSRVNNGASGGGIALLKESTFTMYNGIISDNWASHGGGGVLLNQDNTFTMYDGEIVRNIAEGGNEDFMSGGGGVYLFRRNWFNMYDGKINDNTAGKNGGGIAVNYAQLNNSYDDPNDSVINMYGGEINNNHVEGRNQHAAQGYGGGGGVYLFQGATFNMIKRVGKDAPEIKNNTAGVGSGDEQSPYGTDGGGIYVSRGTLNVISGIITGNTAVGNGGGIFMRTPNANSTNTVKINDPSIVGDIVLGIDPDTGVAIVPDFDSTSITKNTAGGYGGGIFVAAAHTGGYYLSSPPSNGYLYTQLTTASTTVFSGNVASTLSYPPDWVSDSDNADKNYTNIGYASISVPDYFNRSSGNINFKPAPSEKTMYHPLNNYDINYVREPLFVRFSFFKGDAADSTIKLSGARFILQNNGSDPENQGKYYKLDTATGAASWVVDKAQATEVESLANGQVIFDGIGSGDFKLIEVKAPNGYQLPTGYWEITVDKGIITATTAVDTGGGKPPAFENIGTAGNPIYQVGNIKNFQLPLTGNGGYWLMALGLLLLAIGLGRILYKKYKDKQNSPSELEKNIE